MVRLLIFSVAFVFCAGLSRAGDAAKEAKADQERLQGTWDLIGAKENGKEGLEEEFKFQLIFTGDKVVTQYPGEAPKKERKRGHRG